MLNLDCTILSQVVSKALADAAEHPRWLNAINRAFQEVDSNPYIERNPTGHGLIIGSPSGNAYAANGVCSCEAYTYGRPCWHRAAARLVRLHDERDAGATQLAEQVIAIVEQAQVSRAQKLAAARAATAQLNELFA